MPVRVGFEGYDENVKACIKLLAEKYAGKYEISFIRIEDAEEMKEKCPELKDKFTKFTAQLIHNSDVIVESSASTGSKLIELSAKQNLLHQDVFYYTLNKAQFDENAKLIEALSAQFAGHCLLKYAQDPAKCVAAIAADEKWDE